MTHNRRDKLLTHEMRLTIWRKDAAILATCTDCYGSGEDRDRQGRACPTCSGAGRAPREPHVLELLRLEADARQRADRAEVEAGELRREVDRLRVELYRLRDERQAADRRIAQLERALPVWPTRSALTLVDADDDDYDLPSATVQALREAALQLAADRIARLGGDQ